MTTDAATDMIDRLHRDAALYRAFAGRFPPDGLRADACEHDAAGISGRRANPTLFYEVGSTVRRVGMPKDSGLTGVIVEIIRGTGDGPPLYRVEWEDGYTFPHDWTYIVPIAPPTTGGRQP